VQEAEEEDQDCQPQPRLMTCPVITIVCMAQAYSASRKTKTCSFLFLSTWHSAMLKLVCPALAHSQQAQVQYTGGVHFWEDAMVVLGATIPWVAFAKHRDAIWAGLNGLNEMVFYPA